MHSPDARTQAHAAADWLDLLDLVDEAAAVREHLGGFDVE